VQVPVDPKEYSVIPVQRLCRNGCLPLQPLRNASQAEPAPDSDPGWQSNIFNMNSRTIDYDKIFIPARDSITAQEERGQVFAWLLAQVKSCYMLMCGFVKDAS
jgi:hypothetical protein